MFKPRDGYWYIQKKILGGSQKAAQGDGFFIADNPPFGIEFTYYLKNNYLSKAESRIKKEKEKLERGRMRSIRISLFRSICDMVLFLECFAPGCSFSF